MNNENDITRQYSDEEIWNMLKPKMEKMDVKYHQGTFIELHDDGSIQYTYGNYMTLNDVIRLVATIYRSSYVRGRKGRSFIIGEKKKGHWEPCCKGEKLPERTKVKLNEEVGLSNNDTWHFTKNSIGYSTKEKVNVYRDDTWNLFKGEEYPFYSGKLTDRLLKWVEE